MIQLAGCPAPAKINLFLHVIGRRSDGMHRLQTVFRLIDLADTLDFKRRDDGDIVRTNPIAGLATDDDLTVRAARLLQKVTGSAFGVEIGIEKRIPAGGGLGGGSSDAATTLIALNRLWQLGLTRGALAQLAPRLGADVAFFIFGQDAFAEEIGEVLRPLALARRCYVLVYPGVSVSTASIFSAPELTRNTVPIKMSDFSAGEGKPAQEIADGCYGRNDLEPVAAARHPEVGTALAWLGRFGHARMSGSGACLFCAFATLEDARQCLAGLPSPWTGWACESLPEHPLGGWA